jgi:uncharacterized membrane protein
MMKLYRILIGCVTLGTAVAAYLTWVHYFHDNRPGCFITSGCQHVQTSQYSHIFGVPVALIGLIGYLAIALSLLVYRGRYQLATVFMTLVGWVFVLWLTYAEVFLLHGRLSTHICMWCVGNAVIMTMVLILTLIRFWRDELRLPPDIVDTTITVHDRSTTAPSSR